MNRIHEIKTTAIREKDKVWNCFRLFPAARVHKSLRIFSKHELNTLFLLSIETPIELCRFTRTPFFRMEHIMNNPSYKCYSIPKKKGGTREIFSPGPGLKKIQKQLNYFLQAYYLCIRPKEVHGFVINPRYLGKNCNIVANASLHVGKKYLLNMDLKDFFPGITSKRVKSLFQSNLFDYNDQVSTALTLLTTYKGKLPIGAPTSPVISNFICYQLDLDLITFSETHHLVYSRYADDLTFSSNEPITPSIFEEITELIESNHFEINNKKTRITTMNRRQVVTGITVNEKVNVDRKLLKRIRAMTHDLAVNGKEAATRKHFNIQGDISSELQKKFMNRLGGYINFIGQVKGTSDDTFSRLKLSYLASVTCNLKYDGKPDRSNLQ